MPVSLPTQKRGCKFAYGSVKLPYPVKLEVPEATQDGVPSGKFKITGLPDDWTVESYEWKWHTDHHPNAAHLPTGPFFDDKTAPEPTVPKPRWFSTTGETWQANVEDCSHKGAPFRCNYKISCVVTVKGGTFETPKVDWEVFVPLPHVKPPSLNHRRPTVENRYVAEDDTYEAYVKDRNGFARIGPQLVPKGFESRNQFHNKIIAVHENEHIDQWNNQSPWKDLYDADALWEEIQGRTVKGERTAVEPILRKKIDALIKRAIENYDRNASRSADCRERKAHTLSNAVDPNFLEVDLSCAYQSPNYDCDE